MSERSRLEILKDVIDGSLAPHTAAAELDVTEAQICEWTDLVLLSRQRDAPRARKGFAMSKTRIAIASAAAVIVLASFAVTGGVVAQTACNELALPAPLRTFCPQAPARATDVNHNFRTLATLIARRTGAINPSDLESASVTTQSTSTQTLTTNGATVTGVLSFGTVTRQMVNLWDSVYGIGVQGATMYSRTGGNFAWYRGGSHSQGELDPGNGGVALMALDRYGNLQTGGALYALGGLGRTSCSWQASGYGDLGPDNARVRLYCPAGQYAAGWSCYASAYLDGGCELYCCRP